MTALDPVSDDTTSDIAVPDVAVQDVAAPGVAAAGAARRPTIDLTAPPAGSRSAQPLPPPVVTRVARTAPEADGTDAHLLRLCLDLQLDAMLLTLGAAAAQEVRADGAPSPAQVPWRRWVEEDLDLATTLAADALSGRATLPSTLGTELDHDVPATVVDNLVARYESMRDLLTDLLVRDTTASDDDRWRPRVRDALHRCHTRLVELRGYRLTATPPRGVRLPEMSGSPLAPEHHYLPGGLLG